MQLELVDQRSTPSEPPVPPDELSGLVRELGRTDWILNLVLVDDARMTDLREQWYGGAGPTDVLSFSYLESEGAGPPALATGTGEAAHDVWLPPTAPDEPVIAGDVILAPAFVAARCAREQWSLADEWALLVVHGALHVLGWTHDDADGRRSMRAREEAILARTGRAHPIPPVEGGRS
jgi:probable rRNA maturation factor